MSLDFFRKRAGDFGYFFFSALLLFLALYYTVHDYWGIFVLKGYHLPIAVLAVASGVCFLLAKTRLRVWMAVLTPVIVIVFQMLVIPSSVVEFWSSYGRWVVGKGTEYPQWTAGYFVIQVITLAWLSVLAWNVLQRFTLLLGAAAAGIVAAFAVSYFKEYEVLHAGAVFGMGLFIYLLVSIWHRCFARQAVTAQGEEKQAQGREHTKDPLEKKKEWKRHREYMVFLTPVFVVLLFLLLVLPDKKEPFEWKLLKSVKERIEAQITAWTANRESELEEDFQMDMNGLRGEIRLDETVSGNDNAYMDISFDKKQKDNLYLTGTIWQEFDGRQWYNSVSMADEDVRMDALETIYAVACLHKRTGDYLFHAKANVRYEHFHSTMQFAPLKTLEIEEPQKLFGRKEKMLGYGSEYGVRYYQLNLNQTVFNELLEQGYEEDEKEWEKLGYSMSRKSRRYSYEELLAYRERMKERYGQAPQLSEQVQGWLDRILMEEEQGEEKDSAAVRAVSDSTSEKQTSQENESKKTTETENASGKLQKLVRIERALSGFTYTKSPEAVPKKVKSESDFLDYFLLEKQEGYCTHFATAFVLLARSQGYPARLCQGFCTYAQNNMHTTVYMSDAHAWPEVYFEGIGWIPFEPTPGYGSRRYTPWELGEGKTGTALSPADYERYQMAQTELAQAQEKEETEEETDGQMPEDRDEVIMAGLWLVLRIVLGILFLFLLVWLCVMGYLYWQVGRVKRMETEEQFAWLYERNLQLLARLQMVRRDSETLSEFGKRLDAEGMYGTLTMKYKEQIIYGGEPVTTKMLAKLCDESELLVGRIGEREEKGWYLHYQKKMEKRLKRIFEE